MRLSLGLCTHPLVKGKKWIGRRLKTRNALIKELGLRFWRVGRIQLRSSVRRLLRIWLCRRFKNQFQSKNLDHKTLPTHSTQAKIYPWTLKRPSYSHLLRSRNNELLTNKITQSLFVTALTTNFTSCTKWKKLMTSSLTTSVRMKVNIS